VWVDSARVVDLSFKNPSGNLAMDESVSQAETNGRETDLRIGSYRITQPLGTGGMSSVYRAVHVETGHEVALKVLTRTLARNSTLLQRFLREARSAETLEHANIVTIYDRGIDNGRHYLVLEYVAGGDFHEYVHRRGPLGVSDAVLVIKDVARALKYAASKGLIHRDIKPSNILRTPAGQIKLIDLGLALQSENEDERVTREGTTVGTVDYMAPEQARDSRATSIQSDMYSLGCTFYFLLTGVPPFPGGDITEKLTRHAKAPVPDVRDLRQDVPLAISLVLKRMMAKRPEDRFASYDDLFLALEEAPLDRNQEAKSIAILPFADEPEPVSSDSNGEAAYGLAIDEPSSLGSEKGSYKVFSLADLDDDVHPQPAARQPSIAPATPLLRRTPLESSEEEGDADSIETGGPPSAAPARAPGFASVWIVSSAIIGVACILLGVGLIQFLGMGGGPNEDTVSADPDFALDPNRGISSPARSGLATTATGGRPNSTSMKPVNKTSLDAEAKTWVEEKDKEDAPIDSANSLLASQAGSKWLPDWARVPVPDRIKGKFVVVRRVFDPNEPAFGSGEQAVVPTLHAALDGFIGGTVELADEGPHFINDLRVPGESRLIRARAGYRPIVLIEAPRFNGTNGQSAVFTLVGKNLILDGIDLIVNVRDLPSTQTALFSCAGTSLTLRNCSVTILDDPSRSSFVVVRAESSPSNLNPSRILLEKTLVRGSFATGVELLTASTEVVLRKSVILGGPGPAIRSNETEAGVGNRVFIVESILAGPGPIVERTISASTARAKPLLIRALGSTFGRFHGAGISSVIFSNSASQAADKQIDWAGDHNLFAGWKGFFASGKELAVTVEDLKAIRSTWSATDPASREVLSPLPPPSHLATTTPVDLARLIPNQEAILSHVVRPRQGLLEKTIDEYPSPEPPVATGWAIDPVAATAGNNRGSMRTVIDPEIGRRQTLALRKNPAPRDRVQVGGIVELTFDTSTAPWDGDLGAFLRDQVPPATRHARVRVTGSGPHHFTPVRLPRGLWLEIRVDPLAQAEPPSWHPAPQATGSALIELQGGALVLSNVVLKHEETSRLEHLIQVEDGHLVVSHCQFITRKSADNFAGDLIGFRALTTEPKFSDLSPLVFRGIVDRPTCRLDDSTLITDGTALKAELGRGMVAIEQCAISAAAAAVEMVPANVSRRRFEVDLRLNRCTLISEQNVIRLGSWPGLAPGPDRPWLITSRNCAFLSLSDQRSPETVLLRADGDALARGAIFWQETEDLIDVDYFQAAGGGPPINNNRTRDFQHQWIDFWRFNHIRRVSGPRGGFKVRFRVKPRPGRVEPIDLVLDPAYHPGRDRLTVGADLLRQGINAVAARSGTGQIPRPRQSDRVPTGGTVPY
jgi:eukaryotic-like serine/threonine-protein kinase